MTSRKTPQRKSALGRGLDALLEDASLLAKERRIGSIAEIAVAQVQVNPFQPRKDFAPTALQELCDSVALHGIIQPLTVRKLAQSKYQLIAGERRLKAAKMAGITHVPAYIRTADDQQMLEIALVENIQRENLNPIEIALSYQRLLTECKIKQETLGARVGKNRVTVNNYLRLLKLPPEIQLALRDQKIGMGHARALINVETIDAQLGIFKKIIKDNLSVRNVELRVRNISQDRSSKVPYKKKEVNASESIMHNASKRLASRLRTNVNIDWKTEESGMITITFLNTAELHRIMKKLSVD